MTPAEGTPVKKIEETPVGGAAVASCTEETLVQTCEWSPIELVVEVTLGEVCSEVKEVEGEDMNADITGRVRETVGEVEVGPMIEVRIEVMEVEGVGTGGNPSAPGCFDEKREGRMADSNSDATFLIAAGTSCNDSYMFSNSRRSLDLCHVDGEGVEHAAPDDGSCILERGRDMSRCMGEVETGMWEVERCMEEVEKDVVGS